MKENFKWRKLKKSIADVFILNVDFLFYLNRKQQGQLQVQAM